MKLSAFSPAFGLPLILLITSPLIANGGGESNTRSAEPEPVTLNFAMPAGMPGVTMAGIITENPVIKPGYRVNYEVLPSPDMLGAKILSGEAQMAIAPTNLGANLRARDVDIRYVGSMVWGMLYIVTREDITGWEDLRGREIAMLGRGLTPDIVFRHLLTANGLDPESDITLSYVQASTELAPSFISGRSPISIMPEPALSMVITKVPDTKILLDLQREWAKVSNSSESYPQASLFVNGDTADNHTEFVTAFAAEYAASISRILADPAAAGRAASSFLDTPPAGVIAKSIPRGNLEWIPAARARRSLEEYLGVLLDSAPKTVGGSLPDDGFYFITP